MNKTPTYIDRKSLNTLGKAHITTPKIIKTIPNIRLIKSFFFVIKIPLKII